MPRPRRTVTAHGLTLTLDEWAARSGVPAQCLRARLDTLGWPPERAVDTPADKRFRKGGRPRADAPRPPPPLRQLAGGRAGCEWRHAGQRHCRSFGPWGSPEARAAYARFAAAWAASGPGAASQPAGGLAVAGLLLRWLDHCEREYRKRGEATSEVYACRSLARVLNPLYGDTPAADFTAVDLRAAREVMVGQGWARKTCNRQCQRAVRLFRWAAAEGLVPAHVYQSLQALRGLRKGRGVADPPPRRAVPDADTAAVLASLAAGAHPRAAVLAALVTVQRRSGCRPGELVRLEGRQLTRSSGVWRWDIPGDKSEHLDRGPKVAYLGPRSQAALAPLLAVAGEDVVFRWPARKPGGPSPAVSAQTYARELGRACRRAGVAVFSPHRLRHALATEVAAHYASLDHAAAALGDTPGVAGAVYVHLDPREKMRIDAARELG